MITIDGVNPNMIANNLKSFQPTHPGEVLKDELEFRGISQRGLAKEMGMTILTSLHDLNQAMTIGDRFFFLKNGRIIFDTTKDQVTQEMIRDTFDAQVRIVDIEGEKIILTGGEQ